MSRKIIAYRLEPVYESVPTDPPRLMTAAVVTCLATGEYLSGMGGGGDFLSPKIVDALRNDGTSKVIIDAAEYDALVALRDSQG